MAELKRCFWVSLDKPWYVEYHDTEWGVPVHDDQRHFEMLILEGAQAGLSWETILRKRENYRKAFAGSIPQRSPASLRRVSKSCSSIPAWCATASRSRAP